MFEPASAPRHRPLFGLSAAAHAALAAALIVPPLFATPEAPEPDGFVKIDWVPVFTIDVPARIAVDSLRRAREGGPGARAASASGGDARPPVSQPTGIGSVLPDPTGDPDAPFAFEETDERSESGSGVPGETGAPGTGGAGRCEDCPVGPGNAPGVEPPVPVETVSPPYPELARRAHLEGVVVLEAIIGRDGFVRDVRVLRGVSPLLDPAALEAVRKWRYQPARIEGRAVAVYLSVTVTFSLRNL
jgi:protein TonB